MPVRAFWIALGLLTAGVGIVGIFLPLLPTTPFLLIASYAFARSSPRLHRWLQDHPRLGPILRDWQQHGSIRRPIKIVAVATMILSLTATAAMGFATWIVASQAMVLAAAAAFIVTRPEPPQSGS